MRNCALLVAGMFAVVALVGCSDDTVPRPSSQGQYADSEHLPPEQSPDSTEDTDPTSSSDAETVDPEEASGSPAPTVAAQRPGSQLAVAGAELVAPEDWQVSGVSSDGSSEVVSATSDAGQFISLRSVRSAATVHEQIAGALEADSGQAVEAPEIEADGETLRGVETVLTASGGQAVQLQYFVRRGELLITIDMVTAAGRQHALLDHLRSSLTWP